MVLYKCDKCNKEFNQKSNYIRHINRKKTCILNEVINENIKIYKCDKCNKEFNQKSNFIYHINKQNECNDINLEQKYQELEQKYNTVINKNILLENENNKLNENIYR
jgi:uncharacterized C2H2 Zn-finger protein